MFTLADFKREKQAEVAKTGSVETKNTDQGQGDLATQLGELAKKLGKKEKEPARRGPDTRPNFGVPNSNQEPEEDELFVSPAIRLSPLLMSGRNLTMVFNQQCANLLRRIGSDGGPAHSIAICRRQHAETLQQMASILLAIPPEEARRMAEDTEVKYQQLYSTAAEDPLTTQAPYHLLTETTPATLAEIRALKKTMAPAAKTNPDEHPETTAANTTHPEKPFEGPKTYAQSGDLLKLRLEGSGAPSRVSRTSRLSGRSVAIINEMQTQMAAMNAHIMRLAPPSQPDPPVQIGDQPPAPTKASETTGKPQGGQPNPLNTSYSGEGKPGKHVRKDATKEGQEDPAEEKFWDNLREEKDKEQREREERLREKEQQKAAAKAKNPPNTNKKPPGANKSGTPAKDRADDPNLSQLPEEKAIDHLKQKKLIKPQATESEQKLALKYWIMRQEEGETLKQIGPLPGPYLMTKRIQEKRPKKGLQAHPSVLGQYEGKRTRTEAGEKLSSGTDENQEEANLPELHGEKGLVPPTHLQLTSSSSSSTLPAKTSPTYFQDLLNTPVEPLEGNEFPDVDMSVP